MVSRTHDQQVRMTPPSRIAVVARRISWLLVWGAVTTSVVVIVASSGFREGGLGPGLALTATAVGFFVLPDLAFVIGAGEPHEQGQLPRRTVPFYNVLHRIWAPLALTALGGWLVIGSSPPSTPALIALVGGLSWIAHVGIDRATGFGLRKPDGSL